MKTIIIFISVIGFCFAEEPVKPLPKDVQTIVDAREKALQEARIAFDKAVFKANDDAVKKMETVVKSSTQKGDLDGALASKKFVEEWNKEKDSVAVTGALGGAGPKDDLSKMIVGKWDFYWSGKKTKTEFFANKTVKNIDFNIIGTYSVKNNVIEISWQNGDIHKLNYENTKSIRGVTGKNEEIEYIR